MTEERFVKIASLTNEVEADLLGSILEARQIPHVIQSYRDSALDGVYQGVKGWGHLEAPASYKEEILAIIDSMESGAAEVKDEDVDQ